MKPIAIASFFFISALCTPVQAFSKPKLAPSKAVTRDFDAYYYSPMGLTFSGADKNEQFDGDFGYAPVGLWLETKAEAVGGKFEWKYPASVDDNGNITFGTSQSETFRFRMQQPGTFPAPALTVSKLMNTYTYSAATDGIKYGEIGTDSHHAVNYQPSQTTQFDVAPEVLNVNDPDAYETLNAIMAMGASIFSKIKVLGFAESFYYGKDFYLQSISAEVYCAEPLGVDDIAVKVFHRVQTSVDTEEVAKLTPTDVYAKGDNRYFVTFTCDEPTFVTSAIQVVIMPAEGKETRFSPVMPLQKSYHPSNGGTASFYADFSLAGKPVKKQYMDFFGTEVSDDNDRTVGFLNHWAIGIKGSYDKPESGIDGIYRDPATISDGSVYSISGVRVGDRDDMQSLPAGLYICDGKKMIIR